MDDKRFLTLKEAASLFGCSPVKIRKLKQIGKLRYIQHVPRGKLYFSREELERFIRDNTK